jgi:hypothetical protein
MMLKKLFLILAVLLTASCAESQIAEIKANVEEYELPYKKQPDEKIAEMRADIKGYEFPYKLPYEKQDRAMIFIARPSVFGSYGKFNVFLDNKKKESEIGYTKNNQYIFFTVSKGVHKIYSNAENWAEIEINAKSGDMIFIKQNALNGMFMSRNSLEIISDIEGKFYVKNFRIGKLKWLNEY